LLVLILGLVVFLAPHSSRIVADDWRSARIASLGERNWKLVYTVASVIGIALIAWGYGMARAEPVVLWYPPLWTRHLAAALVLVAFVMIAAAYVPRNHFKSAFGHPMYAGVKTWAFAHLISNGTVADVVLFGSFLAWSVLGFRSSRRRDRKGQVSYPPGTPRGTAIAVVAGIAGWVIFAFFLHGPLIGVRPLG
jgi:uncharacterized membrane protein